MSDFDFRGLNGYQIGNLVENRIPFLLVNLGVPLETLFTSVQLIHARNQVLVSSNDPDQVLTKLEHILEEINHRKAPKESAVLVLCESGELSRQLCDQLEIHGFRNVFYATGGSAGIKSSRD